MRSVATGTGNGGRAGGESSEDRRRRFRHGQEPVGRLSEFLQALEQLLSGLLRLALPGQSTFVERRRGHLSSLAGAARHVIDVGMPVTHLEQGRRDVRSGGRR